MTKSIKGMTLVETVIAVVILAIVCGIGVPAIFGLYSAGSDKNAISTAQTINQAQYQYKFRVQNASANWVAAGSSAARYLLIQPYIPLKDSYPTLASIQPTGYTYTLGATLDTKVSITGPSGGVSY